MLRRWLLYLAVLAGCIVFLIAYQQWFAWFVLVAVLCLPVLGLVTSLPLLIGAKPSFNCPDCCNVGEQVTVRLCMQSLFPLPEARWRIRVKDPRTGKSVLLRQEKNLPTEHCTQLLCLPERVRLYDCLGLFFRSVRKFPALRLSVRPRPLPVRNLPSLEQYLSSAWQPKPGGGFAENHELRLYRPGDSLNQIHWKLTAKTGKYIIREPMIPRRQLAALMLVIRGTPEELDRMFGRLLWLGQHLLESNLPFRIHALSGTDMLQLTVNSEQELLSALDQLLSAEPAAAEAALSEVSAVWRCVIGGEPDEA